jgi:hypothetical protein
MTPDEEAYAFCTCQIVDGVFVANPACLQHFPPAEHPENRTPENVTEAVTADAGVWHVITPPADLPGDQWIVVIDTGTGTVEFTRQPAERGQGHGHE